MLRHFTCWDYNLNKYQMVGSVITGVCKFGSYPAVGWISVGGNSFRKKISELSAGQLGIFVYLKDDLCLNIYAELQKIYSVFFRGLGTKNRYFHKKSGRLQPLKWAKEVFWSQTLMFFLTMFFFFFVPKPNHYIITLDKHFVKRESRIFFLVATQRNMKKIAAWTYLWFRRNIPN